MTFQHFNRRLHLYLAMFLMPWFLMYGISSIPFSHPGLMKALFEDPKGPWIDRFDRPYEIVVPEGASDPKSLRGVGEQLVKDAGLTGSFGTYRVNPTTINVYLHTFLRATQLTYHIDQKRLVAKDRKWRLDQFFTGMHARGGFQNPEPLNDTWAVVVDIVCVGFLVWITSGIIMWWQLRSARVWGWIAIAGGAALFALFVKGL
ncbi:MAG: hypothetical protein ACRD44_08000 [Bryobacteraceae bacterium]